MVSLQQLGVLNCSLEGSAPLNQDGTKPHRMAATIRSGESAPFFKCSRDRSPGLLDCGLLYEGQYRSGSLAVPVGAGPGEGLPGQVAVHLPAHPLRRLHTAGPSASGPAPAWLSARPRSPRQAPPLEPFLVTQTHRIQNLILVPSNQ